VAGSLRCVDCAHYFSLPAPDVPAGERLAGTPAPPQSAEDALQMRRQRIHEKAGNFGTLAVLMLVFSILAAGTAVATSVQGDASGGGILIWAAFFLALALWFHLVAQLIHIRVNPER
jgi:hypothetical protein